MSRALLVDATADERAALVGTPVADRGVSATAAGLASALGEDIDIDVAVVGSQCPSPVTVVQQVHAAHPLAGVVVLAPPDTDRRVRRMLSYAPGVPADLTVLEWPATDLDLVVSDLLRSAQTRRRHHALVAAVTSRTVAPAPQRLARASLGALLDHAPFGVLVGTVDGRLLTWNRRAEALLDIAPDAEVQAVAALFADAGPLLDVFALARRGELTEASPSHTVEAPEGMTLEVSAVPTRLEDGSDAVLVLVQDVSARSRAEASRDRLAVQVALLAEVSQALAGTLEGADALRQLADVVVPTLADWVSLQTYDLRGNTRLVAIRHKDPAMVPLVATVEAELAGAMAKEAPTRRIASGEGTVLLPSMTSERLAELVPEEGTRRLIERFGVGSVLAVPLPGRGGVLGSMVLVNRPESPPFTEHDAAIATEVGRRAGVALETAALYTQQRDLAAELQRSLLTAPPQSRHGDIVVRYVAAAHEAQVGGDWYDAFVQADGATVLVIGDVVGHDTRAAAAMGQLRALLRGIGYTTGTGPAEMLSRLDAAIEGLRIETTATAVVARIEAHEAADGHTVVRWSNAGHPPPVVVPPRGRPMVLEGEDADLLLGVISQTQREDRSAALEPGATLLLYTDGLVERRGRLLDEGIAELVSVLEELAGLQLPNLCDRLLDRLVGRDRDDDVALIALRLDGRPQAG